MTLADDLTAKHNELSRLPNIVKLGYYKPKFIRKDEIIGNLAIGLPNGNVRDPGENYDVATRYEQEHSVRKWHQDYVDPDIHDTVMYLGVWSNIAATEVRLRRGSATIYIPNNGEFVLFRNDRHEHRVNQEWVALARETPLGEFKAGSFSGWGEDARWFARKNFYVKSMEDIEEIKTLYRILLKEWSNG